MQLITKRLSLMDARPDWAKSIAERYGVKSDDAQFIMKGLVPSDFKFEKDETASVDYITTKRPDRDSEIVVPKGAILKEYREHPIVLYGHDYKNSGIGVGKNIWIKNDKGGLVAKTQYHTREGSLGKKVWEWRIDGFPMAKSIGFVPIEAVEEYQYGDIDWKKYDIELKDLKGSARAYLKWVLLEYSDVVIPSNPGALEIAINKGLIEKDQFEVIAKDYGYVIEIIDPFKESSDGEQKEISEETETKEAGTDSEQGEEKEVKAERMCECPECGKEVSKGENDSCSMLECPDCKKPMVDSKGCSGDKPKKPKKAVDEELEIELEDDPKEIKSFKPIFKFSVPEEVKEGEEPKRMWNNSLSKLYDIASVPSRPSTKEFDLLCKFLNTSVKDIFQNDFSIPAPLLGGYLAAFKSACSSFSLKDTRNIGWSEEYPPVYEVVKLNSKIEDDFLISGTQYFDAGNETPICVKYSPSWWGMHVLIYSSTKNKKLNKKILSDAHEWIEKNNPLKDEKFALNGEFLSVNPEDNLETVILEEPVEKAVSRAIKLINTKGVDLGARGMLFLGPPGTGKTHSGRILLSQTKHTFIWVSSKDFKDIGAMRGLDLAFSLSRALAPTILFMEDIDSWLYGQGTNDLLKTELDGLRKGKGVITILTSNFPDKLPDALYRPGRFHDILEFDFPSEKARTRMLEEWLGIDEEEDSWIKEVVSATEGYSGAHMRELVDFVKSLVEEDEIDIQEAIQESLKKLNSQKELINRIRNKPEVKTIEVEDIKVTTEIVKSSEEDDEIDFSEAFKEVKKEVQDLSETIVDLVNKISIDKEEVEEKEMIEVDLDKISETISDVLMKVLEEREEIDLEEIIDINLKRARGKMY